MGEPLPFSVQALKRGLMNEYRERRLNLTQQLINQFEDKKRITKPVHIELAFSFRIPTNRSLKLPKLTYKSPHTDQPSLLLLSELALLLLREVVIQKDCSVLSLITKKGYGAKGQTDIIITEEA